jgi:isopentenyl-diphosphate Delta-isomerase
MNEEHVILVDEQDKELGAMEKMQAHREGRLHRAVSVMIFNSKKECLLQKRASFKYHSAGLWSNACCSHPRAGETPLQAASRRLYEEMGIRCELQKMFTLTYEVKLDNGLTEHEFDHVFAGICDDVPLPDPMEVSDWKYTSVQKIREQLDADPAQFTAWFKLIFERVNA